MAPKRQTLDGISARIRPRAYADSYVPKVTIRRLMVDVSAPVVKQVSSPVIPSEKIEILAIQKAKSMIGPAVAPVAPGTHVPVLKPTNTVVRPHYVTEKAVAVTKAQTISTTIPPKAPMISGMVKQIQKVEESKSDNFSVDENGELVENKGLKHRVGLTLQNMFASKRSIAMSAMSTMLLVGGTVALISSFTTNRVVGSQVKALSDKANSSVNESLGATDSSDVGVPSEEKVPEAVVNSYKPPADEPRYIHIPKIKNTKTRVLKMGTGKDDAVQTPRTTWDTGWFDGSSKPGDKVGSALIVGHVSGLTGGGVFYNLYRLTEGDEIIVEMGDGTKYTYRVVSKEEVPADGLNMNNYLVSKDIDKPGLTIMTCAGEYNPVTQTFENRLAVFAVRDN